MSCCPAAGAAAGAGAGDVGHFPTSSCPSPQVAVHNVPFKWCNTDLEALFHRMPGYLDAQLLFHENGRSKVTSWLLPARLCALGAGRPNRQLAAACKHLQAGGGTPSCVGVDLATWFIAPPAGGECCKAALAWLEFSAMAEDCIACALRLPLAVRVAVACCCSSAGCVVPSAESAEGCSQPANPPTSNGGLLAYWSR